MPSVWIYARRDEVAQHREARRLLEGPAHASHLRHMVDGGRTTGNLVHDAHIAALALEHGVREIWTLDRDFARFPGLRIRNPLP